MKRRFVICIASWQNEPWTEKCLQSALSQKDQEFEVMFIDDASSDKTFEIAEDTVSRSRVRATLTKNGSKRGAVHNFYEMIHSCAEDKVVLFLDGDDWLAHENVLNRLAQEYDKGVLLTYGQHGYASDSSKVGPVKKCPEIIVTARSYRSNPFFWSHLRTCYAGLFQKIERESLQREGEFFASTYDQAFMYPMMEMAGVNQAFIPEILYVWNDQNPRSDFRINTDLQASLEQHIRRLPRYVELSEEEKREIRGT